MTENRLENRKLCWSDIPDSARNTLFGVWSDSLELLWAQKSWEFLDKHTLITYSSEVSKTRVLVRLIALAEIYREFCDRAWDERYQPELKAWADELELNGFRLAQCIGPNFEEFQYSDEKELFEAALISLTDQARQEIREVLIQEFGGESLLFVSLWNTVEFSRQDQDDEAESDDIAQPQDGEINWLAHAHTILAEVTPEKMRAFEWVEQGMPRIS